MQAIKLLWGNCIHSIIPLWLNENIFVHTSKKVRLRGYCSLHDVVDIEGQVLSTTNLGRTGLYVISLKIMP